MKELELALELAQEAGTAIMQLYGRTIHTESKTDGTPVTEADVLANQIILDGIRKQFPSDGIVSEELESVSGGRTWYIDPIDGTKGFIRQNGEFAIHIGMCTGEEPSMGVVYRPVTRTAYFGIQGQGAYKQESGQTVPLRIMPPTTADLIAVLSQQGTQKAVVQEQLRRLQPYKTVSTGSNGLRFMKIAENEGDYHITGYDRPCGTWDVCAPQVILEEAGGQVRYTNGESIGYYGQKRLDFMIVAAKTLEQIAQIRGRLGEDK